MIGTTVRRLSLLGIVVLMLSLVVSATTASNTVPASHAWSGTQTITADALKPTACANSTIADLVIGSGMVTGSASNDLILGSAGNDTLGANGANKGSDCCVGGGGTDTFKNSCTVQIP